MDRLKVGVQLAQAHVFKHADGCDAVEAGAGGQMAIVLQPNFDRPGKVGRGDPLGRPLKLIARQGDGQDPGTVVAGGMQG